MSDVDPVEDELDRLMLSLLKEASDSKDINLKLQIADKVIKWQANKQKQKLVAKYGSGLLDPQGPEGEDA